MGYFPFGVDTDPDHRLLWADIDLENLFQQKQRKITISPNRLSSKLPNLIEKYNKQLIGKKLKSIC